MNDAHNMMLCYYACVKRRTTPKALHVATGKCEDACDKGIEIVVLF